VNTSKRDTVAFYVEQLLRF